MDGKKTIQGLTNAWYGYSVFATLSSVLGIRAYGIVAATFALSIWAVFAAIGFVISLVFVTFFSRKLLARSNATRLFLFVISGLLALLGGLSALNAAWAFLHFWTLSLLVHMALAIVYAWMCGRSFTALGGESVRAYCSK
jgi:hypothetical protein